MKAAPRSGFTLVEMLLTSLVLSIGLIALFSLFSVGSAMSRDSRDRQRARAFADAVFASLEWREAGGEGEGVLRLPTEGGSRDLDFGSTNTWPFAFSEVGLADVPRLDYILNVSTNTTNGTVHARLDIRVQGSPMNRTRTYEKTFWPARETW
jgi:prepilin-type N-terminal cleavage/methylation domain-containing protein